jgi:hypothetical protein
MKMQMAMTMGSPKKISICSIYDFTMKMQMATTMGSQEVKSVTCLFIAACTKVQLVSFFHDCPFSPGCFLMIIL